MCGIVCAVSTRNIVPVLVQGLERLEYRGYDSCGVAVYSQGANPGLLRARSTARVSELMEQVASGSIEGKASLKTTTSCVQACVRAVMYLRARPTPR